MNTLGENIRRARERAGMKQKDLAEKLSVSPQTIYRWERGERQPKWEMLQQMAQEMNAPDISAINTSKSQSAEEAKRHCEIPSMAYWGGVIDNVRCVLNNGDKEDISDVYVFLKRAISLITEKNIESADKNLISGVSAYNGSNSSYNAAVMTVNAAVEKVK